MLYCLKSLSLVQTKKNCHTLFMLKLTFGVNIVENYFEILFLLENSNNMQKQPILCNYTRPFKEISLVLLLIRSKDKEGLICENVL